MNNGPWGTGMQPGYTGWSAKNGQVYTGQSSFNPMTYQQKYGSGQSNQQAATPAFDWSKLFGQEQAPKSINVQTSITPQDIYSPQQTAYATNQGVANALGQGDPYTLSKELDRPGMSRSAATQRNIQPAMMQARAQGAQVQAEQPFADAAANANHRLQGQTARESEALGWGSVGSSIYQNQLGRQLSNNQQAMTLLSSLLRG